MNQKSDAPDHKKPLVYYALVAMMILLLLNTFVFPSLLQRQVVEVAYSQFLEMVEQGSIKEVASEEGQLIFLAEDASGNTFVGKTASGRTRR